MAKGKEKDTIKEIERLLNQQTVVILSAVDEKLKEQEARINNKIDRLTTTLDKFLKRLTDIEDEFKVMKLDINRVKKVIRDRLGVDLTNNLERVKNNGSRGPSFTGCSYHFRTIISSSNRARFGGLFPFVRIPE